MDKIEVTLEICTLYKGIPYGLSLISYKDPKDTDLSFKGIGLFNEGLLHAAPFTYVTENGWRYSLSKMENGRPANNSYMTLFYPNGTQKHVESLKNKTDVSGW